MHYLEFSYVLNLGSKKVVEVGEFEVADQLAAGLVVHGFTSGGPSGNFVPHQGQ